MPHWRTLAATPFSTEKRPATGSRGMVVTNHPLASAAGAEMLAAGGNAGGRSGSQTDADAGGNRGLPTARSPGFRSGHRL